MRRTRDYTESLQIVTSEQSLLPRMRCFRKTVNFLRPSRVCKAITVANGFRRENKKMFSRDVRSRFCLETKMRFLQVGGGGGGAQNVKHAKKSCVTSRAARRRRRRIHITTAAIIALVLLSYTVDIYICICIFVLLLCLEVSTTHGARKCRN